MIQKKSLRRRGETRPATILCLKDLSRFLPITFSQAAIDQRADDVEDQRAQGHRWRAWRQTSNSIFLASAVGG